MTHARPVLTSIHHSAEESRKRLRFPLEAPCRFWWRDETSGLLFGTGRTRDLSSDGIRIAAAFVPKQSDLIAVEVDLPGSAEKGDFLLCGEGRVVRADRGLREFAAQITFERLGNSECATTARVKSSHLGDVQ